ncbi:DUF2852 domain-containing protein [Thiosocius teredinicola]|uniref:DUF2852 domain-containing protein n=1 Tax=Thiosocius teredinicola TaxID=1973002 RepID=UPI0009912F56
MSSTNYSSPGHSHGNCSHAGKHGCGGHWSGANIAAMVLGFIVFPPIGLVVLVWTLMGRPIQDLPGWVRDKWSQYFGNAGVTHSHGNSDNVVFDEYQQTQHDRIREIKDEIKRRAEAFRTFRFDAKRRQDKAEFDEFMASNPGKGGDER